jgi:hypothetical protein
MHKSQWDTFLLETVKMKWKVSFTSMTLQPVSSEAFLKEPFCHLHFIHGTMGACFSPSS